MQLNYKLMGQGPVVIIMHGLFGSLENLNIIAKALSHNYTVINVDLRNHGSSFHSESMSYENMANDILSLFNILDITKAHIVGHSMGGKVAMQFTTLYSDMVDKLVVLDIAPVTYHSRHDNVIDALNAVDNANVSTRSEADILMKPYLNEVGVRQFLLKSLVKAEQGYQWKFNLDGITENYHHIISNINGSDACYNSTLFIKGSQSDYILPEHRDSIVSLFPNSKAKVIHGAGHWLHAEKPEAVNRSIIDFLK